MKIMAKMGADRYIARPKMQSNTPKLMQPICQIGPNVWDIVKVGFIGCP